VALRLLAKELAARREYEEDRRHAQASRVVCWLVEVPTTSTFTPTLSGPTHTYVSGDHLELVLHNGSDEPVFDCRLQEVGALAGQVPSRTSSARSGRGA